MKKKIVLSITLVTILASVIVPQNIEVEASEDYGDPGVNYDYIYTKTDSLSQIVFHPSSEGRGREFGETGERKAADYIKDWMNEIGLENVHNETIDQYWEPDKLNLSVKKQYDKNKNIRLDIRVIDKQTQEEIACLDDIECFPFLNYIWCNSNSKNVRVVESFQLSWRCSQIVLLNHEWWRPWHWWDSTKLPWIYFPKVKGFILIDDPDANVNTMFMGPSYNGTLIKAGFAKPGFSITHTDGQWIRNYLDDYIVLADIKSEWKNEFVESYNVIGQINGTDTGKVSIICAHYDCWNNQGTIDEALETALVLGIAKHIKDRELESNLKHTVKFIAFAGEENTFRGSKDYVNDHTDEIFKYIINPGNFGHGDTYYYNNWGRKKPLNFETPSDNETLRYLVKKIAEKLEYKDRTGGIEHKWNLDENELKDEDSLVFFNNAVPKPEGVMQFARWPFKGYHRDGSDHTEGDVMELLDNDTWPVECEVVASVALHLIVDSEHRFDYVAVVPFDDSGNGEVDSVQVCYTLTSETNTSLFGRVKGGFYNSSDQCLEEKESCLYFLEKNETVDDSFIFSVPSDQSTEEFTVRLVLMDYWDEVDDWYNETVNLSAYSLSTANFSYAGQSVKTFNFTDGSSPSPNGTITSWNWSFGDGNHSNLQNPNYTYYDNGTYNVSLTIIDSNNLSNTTYMYLIVENEPPSAIINKTANIWCINDSINFTSVSSDSDGSIVNWTWDFGDGNYSYTSNVTYNYSKSGFYTVNLTVTDDDNSSNSTTLDMIIAGAMIDDSYQDDSPDTYRWRTIQSGVSNVTDDDIIYVNNGNYNESVVVNKTVYLLGENENYVNVYNNGGIVFDVQNDSVVLNNLTITDGNTGVLINSSNNCSIINCNISFSTYGIKISTGANNNSIQKCIFKRNSYGVFISGSYNKIGSKNIYEPWNDTIFSMNTYGVYFDNSNDNIVMGCSINASSSPGGLPPAIYGICLDDSDNNSILHCDIFNANTSFSNGYGIYQDYSTSNYIFHCFIHDNNKGVYLTSSSDNHITLNNISNNSAYGLSINMFSSVNNTVCWNDFIGNGDDRSPQSSDEGSSNNWNTENNETYYYVAGGEGNYWSDYTGVDGDGDGIGDTGYTIPGTPGSVDAFPVMVPRDFFN